MKIEINEDFKEKYLVFLQSLPKKTNLNITQLQRDSQEMEKILV